MKLYESAYTYVPFIYLYICSTAIGTLYHSETPGLHSWRPYTVLAFLLLNVFVYRFYKKTTWVRFALHRHFWKACTLAFFGIIINNVHELMFRDFHFVEWRYNAGLSLAYIALLLACGYWLRSDTAVMYLNIVFLFFPIKRDWQVNLYIYVLFVTVAIFLTYSRCTPRSLVASHIQYRPVLKFFPYLRVHDYFIWVGLVQLYVEYHRRYVPDAASVAEIERIIGEESDKVLTETDGSDLEKNDSFG
jgi:hypothetical protein